MESLDQIRVWGSFSPIPFSFVKNIKSQFHFKIVLCSNSRSSFALNNHTTVRGIILWKVCTRVCTLDRISVTSLNYEFDSKNVKSFWQGRNMVYGLRAQSPKYGWDQGSEERAQGSEEWDQGSQGF